VFGVGAVAQHTERRTIAFATVGIVEIQMVMWEPEIVRSASKGVASRTMCRMG
jgi:hypothetical protein